MTDYRRPIHAKKRGKAHIWVKNTALLSRTSYPLHTLCRIQAVRGDAGLHDPNDRDTRCKLCQRIVLRGDP